MFNTNPVLGKSSVESLLLVGQRIVFGCFERYNRVDEELIHPLIGAVHQSGNVFRQNAYHTVFEHSEIMRCSNGIVNVQYFFVFSVYHDLILCRVPFFYLNKIPLDFQRDALSAVLRRQPLRPIFSPLPL